MRRRNRLLQLGCRLGVGLQRVHGIHPVPRAEAVEVDDVVVHLQVQLPDVVDRGRAGSRPFRMTLSPRHSVPVLTALRIVGLVHGHLAAHVAVDPADRSTTTR